MQNVIRVMATSVLALGFFAGLCDTLPALAEIPASTTQPSWDSRKSEVKVESTPATNPADVGWRLTETPELRRVWDAMELEMAPSLKSLTYLDESATVEKRLTGKTLLIAFWSPNSPASVKAMEELSAHVGDLGANVEVVAVTIRASAAQMKKAVESRNWPFVFATDANGELNASYKPSVKLPRFYVVDANGIMRVASANPEAVPEIQKSIAAEAPWPSYPERQNVAGINSVNDVQGMAGPRLDKFEWFSPVPNGNGKVTVIYVFDTTAMACVNWFPHLNEELEAHWSDCVLICVTKDSDALVKRYLTTNKVDGSIAIDSHKYLDEYLGPHGPNYTLVLSSDWIVRWQGSGGMMRGSLLQKFIDADPVKIKARLKEMKAAAEKEKKRSKKSATTQKS